jgi:hypothetical protein
MSTSPSSSKLYTISAILWASTFGLWIILWFFNPYSQTDTITIPGVIILLLASTGVISSYLRKPILLLSLALISFFPIGFYLMGTPGIFALIGILNLLAIILAAVILFRANKGH